MHIQSWNNCIASVTVAYIIYTMPPARRHMAH